MNLIAALNANPSVLAEFKVRATPMTKSSDLLAWLKSLPEMQAMGFYWPSVEALRPIRRQFGCPAGRGGARGGGKPFYSVARHRKGAA